MLHPLDQTCLANFELNTIKDNSTKVKEALNNMKYGENISFEEFLNNLNLNEQDYISAISLSLTRDTLFLKRTQSEIRVNNYNSYLLRAWQANLDIHFILDPYACAVYILSYVTKEQGSMSRL